MTTLFVDRLFGNQLAGITTDPKKAEYILAIHRMNMGDMAGKSSMFGSGEYVIALNIDPDFKMVNVGIMHFTLDLDKHFDAFADCLSPKAVQGFHTTRQAISKKKESERNAVELSDDESDFEIAYRNYKDYHNHQ